MGDEPHSGQASPFVLLLKRFALSFEHKTGRMFNPEEHLPDESIVSGNLWQGLSGGNMLNQSSETSSDKHSYMYSVNNSLLRKQLEHKKFSFECRPIKVYDVCWRFFFQCHRKVSGELFPLKLLFIFCYQHHRRSLLTAMLSSNGISAHRNGFFILR